MKVTLRGDIRKEFKAATTKLLHRKIDRLVSRLKTATPVDTGEARDGWHRVGNTIVNNVDHISYLNEGSSPQASAHFVESTVLSEPGVVPVGTIVKETSR